MNATPANIPSQRIVLQGKLQAIPRKIPGKEPRAILLPLGARVFFPRLIRLHRCALSPALMVVPDPALQLF